MKVIKDEESKHPNGTDSRLLSVPAELRAHIFSYIIKGVRCRRPIIIWDEVCTSVPGHTLPVEVAILLTCRTTDNDCISLLYDETTVEISIQSGVLDDSVPMSHFSLGAIEECSLLTRLRHVELEVMYNGSDREAIERVADRLRNFASVSKHVGKLKTIDLTFYDERRRYSLSQIEETGTADSILDASMDLVCEKFIAVARNLAARTHMGTMKWKSLRNKVSGTTEGEEERFREISFDYWKHAFMQ